MDPVSITVAAASLVFTVVKNGRALVQIYEKYTEAHHAIFALQTECTILATALSQIQVIFSKEQHIARRELPETVMEALDLALTACTLTLSVLSKEIESLLDSGSEATSPMTKRQRVKYVWKDDSMQELLAQLRGQSSALNLLLRAFDSTSIDKILQIVQSGRPAFQKVEKDAASIRSAHPGERYATSILDMSFDDSKTIYELDPIDSLTSETSILDISGGQSEGKALVAQSGPIAPPGWTCHFSAQHDEWFYVNMNTKQSQWEKPVVPSSPPKANLPVIDKQKEMATLVTEYDIDPTPWLLNTDQKLFRAINELRTQYHCPGLVVASITVDSAPTIRAFGVRKQGNPTPVTQADKFILANAECMIATVIGLLVERGSLAWEYTLSALLPKLGKRMHLLHKETTLEMLCTHRSGIRAHMESAEDGQLWSYLTRPGVQSREGRSAVVLWALSRPPDSTSGEEELWLSANVLIMAAIVEEQTGSEWMLLVKQLIFDPLEMYHSGVGRPDKARNATSSNPVQPWAHHSGSALPLDPTQGKLFEPTAKDPICDVHISVFDLATFVKLHLRGACDLPTLILTPATFKKLHTTYDGKEGSLYTPGSWKIGTRPWANGKTISAWARGCGFALSIWIAPETKKAYLALANIDGDDGLQITDQVAALLIRRDQC